MDLNFLLELPEMPTWKALKSLRTSEHFPMYRNHFSKLSSYDLVFVWVDDQERPVKLRKNKNDVESYFLFTSEVLANKVSKTYSLEEVQADFWEKGVKGIELKVMMLGELMTLLSEKSSSVPVKVNPILSNLIDGEEAFYLCEEVLFAPTFDEVTKKLLLSNPEEAMALLAIAPEDQKRFGIELVFNMVTNRDLSEEKEERENSLREKLEELSFTLPRVPIKKGSGSFLIVILNLENKFEEAAFIRSYKTFDDYSDVLFITSSLELLTGQLENVKFDGERIDTIFTPMIRWQQNRNI